MILLLLSILFSTITVSFFKVFEIKKVDTFQAIIANYLTCGIIGLFYSEHAVWSSEVLHSDWLGLAFLLGLLFISIFYCIALTAQQISVSASMVAAKLSVVVPVLLAWFLYQESLSALKIAGIFISLLAVYFISKKSGVGSNQKTLLWFLPILVFIGSGSIDSILNYLEQHFIPPYSADEIVTSAFSFAFLTGLIWMAISIALKKMKLSLKSLLWGVFLGVPNYFSMYFLVKTLGVFPATFIFPINNIGIVAFSTLLALLFFKEKLSKQNYIGLGLSILAILLISLS
ncbi:MAG: hypothetical protein CFE21_12555 [Bacteroidetes bacterium B1(2017)]|nr:MAG: hypothetical protein CFE21_12555 [Bacteroidetes bacterium B1(2017)]